MKIACLLLIFVTVVTPPISARNVHHVNVGVVNVGDDNDHLQHLEPRFISWFSNLFNGHEQAASDGVKNDQNTIADQVGDAAKKAGKKLVNDAVTSTLGANGAETLSKLKEGLESGDKKNVAGVMANAALSAMGPTGTHISNIGQAVQSGDHMKVAGAVADAALNAALGPSGSALAKTGIGAAGHGLKLVGGVFGGALSKIGGDSAIGKLGNSIQDGSSKVSGHMTEYGGGDDAVKPSAGQLVGQVADVALTIGLGPAGGALAKTGIGAAGKLIQFGGGLVGNKLSQMGGDSALGKLGNAIQGGSKVVGGTMSQVGGTQSALGGVLGNTGLLAAGQALQKTGNMIGGALTKVAGNNESLANLGQTIQSGSQAVDGTMNNIGNGDIDKVINTATNSASNLAAAAA